MKAMQTPEAILAYYKKVLQDGEEVRFLGTLHWVIYRWSITWVLLAAASGVASVTAVQDGSETGWRIASAVLFALSVLSFLPAWFRRVTTEIVVTNRRVIYKRGWISRRTEEMNVNKIETVDVNQSIFGRILGYGNVLIKGVGSSWEPLRRIASPIALRNAVATE